MKIKSILFDLDGVLVDACEWHYIALNQALTSIGINPISIDDHVKTYNGLPTSVKLEMLGLQEEEKKLVWELKQKYTLESIRKNSKIQNEKIKLFAELKKMGIKIVCVTNSIRETAIEMLTRTGQIEYFDLIITNEDVIKNKPNPDCYNTAVERLNLKPMECVIVEDSPKGIEAAKLSVIPNSNIWIVKNSKEVTLENFRKFIYENFNSDGR